MEISWISFFAGMASAFVISFIVVIAWLYFTEFPKNSMVELTEIDD